MKPTIIGITGGSGSGKTYFSHALAEKLGDECLYVSMDSFYKHTGLAIAHTCNFDEPDSLDLELFCKCLGELLREGQTRLPNYDFATHERTGEYTPVQARRFIITEGIFLLHDRAVRDLIDVKVFIDTDSDIRLGRRVVRDVNERGRTPESVIDQYMSQVRPSHIEFVEPAREHADFIFRGDRCVAQCVEMLQLYLRAG